jgi:hypothetical protein
VKLLISFSEKMARFKMIIRSKNDFSDILGNIFRRSKPEVAHLNWALGCDMHLSSGHSLTIGLRSGLLVLPAILIYVYHLQRLLPSKYICLYNFFGKRKSKV